MIAVLVVMALVAINVSTAPSLPNLHTHEDPMGQATQLHVEHHWSRTFSPSESTACLARSIVETFLRSVSYQKVEFFIYKRHYIIKACLASPMNQEY